MDLLEVRSPVGLEGVSVQDVRTQLFLESDLIEDLIFRLIGAANGAHQGDLDVFDPLKKVKGYVLGEV